MKIENNTLKVTITDMLEEVKESMCDKYCKYPEKYGAEQSDLDELYDTYCSNCPMNIL